MNDKYHGQGVYCDEDGTVYMGEFERGDKHGTAQVTYKNGDIFTGDFIKGKENGNGQINYINGGFFNGIYLDGKRNGHGRLLFTNDQGGEQYMGEWKDGTPGGGRGYYITETGDKIEGSWVEGRIVITSTDDQPLLTRKDALKPTKWDELSDEEKGALLMINLQDKV